MNKEDTRKNVNLSKTFEEIINCSIFEEINFTN